jgi:membrane protein YqaA with SNARE-associated domain
MIDMEEEQTKSGFLFRNLLRGLIFFVVIITVFLVGEDFLVDNFKSDIDAILDKPLLIYTIFFASEVLFGLVPPEFFMMVWILHKVAVSDYIISLVVLTVLSYVAGIIGYFIGRDLSRTKFLKRISERYLEQYQKQLKKYGGYLVFVGAITPIPFSATCMLAGSVNIRFRVFLLICIARIFRFAFYGWLVWAFPNWFSF